MTSKMCKAQGAKPRSAQRRTYRRRWFETVDDTVRERQDCHALQADGLHDDRLMVSEIQRRVRRFLVIGVFADRVRVIGRIVIDVVVRVAAVRRVRRMIGVLCDRLIRVMIGMRGRQRGRKDQRCNQYPDGGKKPTHAKTHLPQTDSDA